MLSICVPKKLTVPQLASRKERREKYKLQIKKDKERKATSCVQFLFCKDRPQPHVLQSCLLSASGNNNQEVKMYRAATRRQATESVLKWRSDRPGILGAVGRRVLRLHYMADANAQVTQSQNS